jgi:hypothetical protein
MTSKEFVIWLKGFTEGVHDFNITPKQWDLMKEKLEQVQDEPQSIGVPIGVPYAPQYPFYTDPYNPYRVTCDGTGTTPIRTSGYSQRTDANNINPMTLTVTTGSSGIIYTSTNFSHQSGSWHYTVGNHVGIKDFSPADTLDIDGQITDKILLHD